MKRGIIAAVLLCMCLCTACGHQEEMFYPPEVAHSNPKRIQLTETEPVTGAETETEAGNVPEAEPLSDADAELQRRLKVIVELEPEPIPEEGWTDETLLPLINIGGTPGGPPVCVSDLLYGYALTGEHAEYYTEHADEVFVNWLTYSGNQCFLHHAFGDLDFPPRVETHDPAIPDGADDHELEMEAQWCVTASDGSCRYPVSVNCVTIGSTYDELMERIGLSDEDSPYDYENLGEEDFDWFSVHCRTESVNIIFNGSQNIVHTIWLTGRDA